MLSKNKLVKAPVYWHWMTLIMVVASKTFSLSMLPFKKAFKVTLIVWLALPAAMLIVKVVDVG